MLNIMPKGTFVVKSDSREKGLSDLTTKGKVEAGFSL